MSTHSTPTDPSPATSTRGRVYSRLGRRVLLRGLVGGTVVLAALAWSCASGSDGDRVTTVLAPDATQFDQGFVSYFLEKRCGTLDCHGQVGRPLRIYGRYGLRLPNDAGLTPISGDTSQAERAANYRAVIALEPEEMSRVVAGVDGVDELLVIRKPIGTDEDSKGVRHKGGSVIARGDDGYLCLTTWITSQTTPASRDGCRKAADKY